MPPMSDKLEIVLEDGAASLDNGMGVVNVFVDVCEVLYVRMP